MITWMQTHKKWLIVTIWIATIAFVGAGFVGWGAYSYGKKQDEVAKVKDTPIKVKDVQAIYSQLFNQLNQMMGGKLDEATAKKFGLQKAAFQRALQKAMLIQFAKDNGIYVTDDDLAKNLIAIPAFQKNGKFDRALYNMFLQNQRMTANEFETGLRKDISVEKIMKALNLPSTKTTQTTFAGFMLMQDKISIKTIKAPKVTVTDEEIKTYWQKHKEEYKSVLSYNIGYYYVPLDKNITDSKLSNYYDEHKDRYTNVNGEILSFDKAKKSVAQDLMAKKTKRNAILTMKKLKNGNMKFEKVNNVTLNNKYLSIANMQKLIQNQFLKPVLTQKGWLIAKLFTTNKPTTLSYNKAKLFAKNNLIIEKTRQSLIDLAKNNLKDFKGKNIGFIGRDDVMKLKSMSIDEANQFIQTLFNSTTQKGFVLLPTQTPTKVVLFNITEQKLLNKSKFEKYKTMIVSYSNKLKTDEFNKNLINQLEKLYQAQIKLYMKM